MTNKFPTQEVEKELIAIATQLLAESGEPFKREVQLDDSLQRHLGIDSLARAELFQRIEKRFSMAMSDQLLAEAETLGDIANYIQQAEPGVKRKQSTAVIDSHGEQTNIDPSRERTLIDVLLLYAENAPEKPHIYFQKEDGKEEVITYGHLLASAKRIAANLRDQGLQEGETVAIMQPSDPVFFYTFMGVLLAGGVPVPIYPPFRMHMLEAYAKTEAHILKNAEVRMLVTFEKAETLSRLLQAFVPSLRVVTTAHELLREPKVPLEKPFLAKTDSNGLIQYTSGSTNDPKGVLLTHRNLLANIRAYGKAIHITPKDVAVSWLPLYHDMGLIGAWLGSFYHGIPLVLMTPFSFLNHPERWLWAIHYHRGTISGAPNFAYELCVRKVDPSLLEGLDLSSWRVAANGAEKVYPGTLNDFANRFAHYGFKRATLTPMYGLAESTVALTIPAVEKEFHVDYVGREPFEEHRHAMPSDDVSALAFVSCGPAIDGHEIRIVNDDNHVLPERMVGNLQFRGPSSMQGYYHNPSATQAIYHDGWLETGDLAYVAEGELYITGRRKDLIIKAGRNLYPVEIEELVGKIEGVRQGCVAVFGVTDTNRATEQLIVVAETRVKDKALRNTIVEKINETIASNLDMVPDHVELVMPHTVPKTSSGKLQRSACKKMYLEHKLNKWHMPAWVQMVRLAAQMATRKSLSFAGTIAKIIYTSYMALLVGATLIPIYFLFLISTSSFCAKVCRYWMKFLILMSLCRVKVVGGDNVYKATPAIFVVNHASYIDAAILFSVLPTSVRFVGKKELFSVPIIRTLMRKLKCLSVDRMDFSKGLEDTRQIEMALKSGDSISIFPEGTFGYSSGLRPFRLGAFKIAAEANVAVVPMGLNGTRFVLRDSEKLMRPGKIIVTVGEPIMPSGVEWQDVTRLRNMARDEVVKYCGEPSLDFIAAQKVAPKHHEE